MRESVTMKGREEAKRKREGAGLKIAQTGRRDKRRREKEMKGLTEDRSSEDRSSETEVATKDGNNEGQC